MNGALYPQPQGALMDPRSAMIMQMGLGLMAGSGPSRTPVSFGQTMGQAGMQGMNAYNIAQRTATDERMRLGQEDERKKREEALSALAQDPRFKGMENLLRVSPAAAIEQAYPKPTGQDSPFAKISPKDYTPESVQRFSVTRNPADLVAAADPAKAATPSELSRYQTELAAFRAQGLPDTDPRVQQHVAKIKKLTEPSSPLVQMGQEETSFQKRVGTEFGDMYSGLMRADMNAPTNIAKYQRLEGLLGQVKTGKFTGTTQQLKAAAKAAGIDLEAIGVRDDVAPAQAAVALSNQLALELRNPAGGAGMPGAMSDQDRNFLIAMVPGLENDPNAIPTMIDYRVRLAKREQQVAKMARDYRKRTGKFDEGFYDELAEWSKNNHMFKDEKKSNVVDFGSLK